MKRLLLRLAQAIVGRPRQYSIGKGLTIVGLAKFQGRPAVVLMPLPGDQVAKAPGTDFDGKMLALLDRRCTILWLDGPPTTLVNYLGIANVRRLEMETTDAP